MSDEKIREDEYEEEEYEEYEDDDEYEDEDDDDYDAHRRSKKKKKKLGTGAKVGIIVGILLIGALIVFFVMGAIRRSMMGGQGGPGQGGPGQGGPGGGPGQGPGQDDEGSSLILDEDYAKADIEDLFYIEA